LPIWDRSISGDPSPQVPMARITSQPASLHREAELRMAQIDILLPKMGESVAEATIIKWLKNEGDRVEADEALVEIATDKVDSEVPAPQAGILLKRSVQEGDVEIGRAHV